MVGIVSANAHDRAKADCRAAGFSSYFPMYRERRVLRGKVTWITRPLLDGYFFVKEHPEWRELLSLKSVFGLLLDPDFPRPALACDAEIQGIRDREDRSGFVQDPQRELRRNQAVRAAGGALVGSVGRYDRIGRGGTDVAFMEILGSSVRVEFAPGVLRAA